MSTSAPDRPFATWFKSSYSNPSQACVEVRFTGGSVQIRDSKDLGTGPVITVPSADWPEVLAEASGQRRSGRQALRIAVRADGGADVWSGASPTLSFTQGEWDAFVAGVRDGEFELPRSSAPAA